MTRGRGRLRTIATEPVASTGEDQGEQPMFVVTGATGNVGREVVAELVARGVPVRAVVRDPASTAPIEGAELVRGDLTAPATIGSALRAADGAFLLPGYPGLAEAARSAGVRRIVQLSGGSAGSAD